jgi:hypothetical protein
VRFGKTEIGAQQIGERALSEPLAVQEPFAAGRNQPVGDEDEQHLVPACALAACRQALGEELVQA